MTTVDFQPTTGFFHIGLDDTPFRVPYYFRYMQIHFQQFTTCYIFLQGDASNNILLCLHKFTLTQSNFSFSVKCMMTYHLCSNIPSQTHPIYSLKPPSSQLDPYFLSHSFALVHIQISMKCNLNYFCPFVAIFHLLYLLIQALPCGLLNCLNALSLQYASPPHTFHHGKHLLSFLYMLLVFLLYA